jgi:glycosyltransferase involved in cell wall biosynthesis
MLEAVAIAYKRGAHVTFDIMGAGEQSEALHRLADELGIGDCVEWLEPRSYGESFFEVLRERDVLLACPVSADTPRSAWDALASAMPLVAFDTPFYKSMAEISHAVELTKWPEVELLADKLVELAADKRALAPLVKSAVATARENTGASWLKRRVAWVSELMGSGKRLLAPIALVAHEWNDVICALA